MTPPTIYSIDEPGSTIYVLIENGNIRAWHWWPHPLRRLCPEAADGGTLGGEHGRLLPGRMPSFVEELIAAAGFAAARTEVP